MKTSPLSAIAIILGILGALAVSGCRHTWDGVKTDTKKATQKTGQGIEKVGSKIEKAGDKK